MFLPIPPFLQIADILLLHNLTCFSSQNQHPRVQLSLDGVQESKSGGYSLDTYCISFENCRNVYPIKIMKAMNKHKYDEQRPIKSIINEINVNNLVITDGIFDNPKRSIVRCAMSHSAMYACEYCVSPAISYIDNNVQKNVTSKINTITIQLEDITNQINFLRTSPGTVASKNKDDKSISILQDIANTLKTQEKEEKKKLRKKLCVWVW